MVVHADAHSILEIFGEKDRVSPLFACVICKLVSLFLSGEQGPCVPARSAGLGVGGCIATAAPTMEIRLDSKGVWLDIGQACEDDVTAMEGVARTVL